MSADEHNGANRFALRAARAVTGRPRILVLNACYHGSVERPSFADERS